MTKPKKKKKKPGVPTKETKTTQFDLNKTVYQYAVYEWCWRVATEQGLKNFFEGVIMGYVEWFNRLDVPQELITELYKNMDGKKIEKEARVHVKKVREKAAGKVLISSGAGGEAKIAKQIFDRQLGGKK